MLFLHLYKFFFQKNFNTRRTNQGKNDSDVKYLHTQIKCY